MGGVLCGECCVGSVGVDRWGEWVWWESGCGLGSRCGGRVGVGVGASVGVGVSKPVLSVFFVECCY